MICKNCGQVLGEGTKVCPICKTVQDDQNIHNNHIHINEEKPQEEQKQEVAVEQESMLEKVEEHETDQNRTMSVSLYEEEKREQVQEKYPYSPRSRVLAGLLQIFLGGFGIGRFYLGYNGIALGQLFTMPIFFIGSIWGIIDGILILCGQVECDANGVPLE